MRRKTSSDRIVPAVLLFAALAFGQPAVGQERAASAPPSTDAVLEISLERAIDIAKETSFRLSRSQRYIDGALARYKATSSMYRPRFDSSVSTTQSGSETPGSEPGLVPQFGASLNLGVTQPLDIGGVIGRQVTQAELARRAAEYDLAQSHLDVSLEVETNYYNALRAQEIVRVDEQIFGDLERLAAEVGAMPGDIGSFIQVELANARQTLTSSHTILDLSLDTLKQSLRLAPGTAIRLTDSLSYKPVAPNGAQTLQEALAKRPDLGRIGVQIEQTQLAAEQVSDVRKPTLNLQLFSNDAYNGRDPGRAFDNPLTYDHGVMVTLNVPLVYFDWGFLSETKRAAFLQNEQTRFDLQEQRERVGLEVRQAVIALQRAEQRVKTLPDLALARDALRRAESDFLAPGKSADPATLAQMSNARASLRFAETLTIDALYEYNTAVFRLKYVIGTS